MSVTVYAAEGDNTEAGFQPAEEGTVQSADTEQTQETASEQTEEKDPEENGLDSFIYIREKEDKITGKAKVKKVTIEELKEEIDANQVPELAAVVFQFSDEEFETEALTENTTEFETETQSETTESESETATETETESETDKDSEIEKYPTVELSDMQKDMVYEVAELVPQTVVIFNQCELENNLVFTDCKEVTAVTVLKADTEKELKKAIQEICVKRTGTYDKYIKFRQKPCSATDVHSDREADFHYTVKPCGRKQFDIRQQFFRKFRLRIIRQLCIRKQFNIRDNNRTEGRYIQI